MYNEETGQYEWIFVEQDISNEFKADCKSIVNSYLRTGRISVLAKQLNDGTILPAFEIKQSDNLIDFTIEDNCYANDKFIGTAVGKTIKVKIFNPDNTIDLEDRTADVYVGMDIEGTNEEILMGRFIFDKNKTEEVKNKSEFTGSDAMIRFNQLYKDVIKFDNDRQYPISLYTYLQWLCNEVGVVLGNESIVNGDYQVLGNAFTNNEDCKTVLSHIAQISGGIAKIGRDNKLYIINLEKDTEEAVETITTNNYLTDFTSANDWGELNSLVLSLSQDIEGENVEENDPTSIEENGLTEMVLTNNFILIDDNERRLVLPELWNTLKYLKYLPIQTKYFGYPYLDSGDLIAIYDTASQTTRYTYLFNHTFRYSGAYEGEIKTPALTKTQTAYKNNINIKQQFRNTELIVDKVKGEISSVVTLVNGASETASNALGEASDAKEQASEAKQTANGFSGRISDIETANGTLTKEIADLKATVNGLQLKLTEQGGNNIFYYSTEFWSDGENGQPNMIKYFDSETKTTSISGIGYKVSTGTSQHQTIEVKDDYYTISFKYKRLNVLANVKVVINSQEIPLTSTTWDTIVNTQLYSNGVLDFKIVSDADNSVIITDLMGSVGSTAQPWTQNPNETRTDTVTIGKGIEVTSSTTDTRTKIDSDGNRVYNSRNQIVMEATDKGMKTQYLESTNGADISGLMVETINNQIWLASKWV